MMKRRRTQVVVLASLLLPACEEPFEPLQASDGVFSLYGVLDVSADTQWIRVMPVRGSIFTEREPIDATVTLEHLGTGRIVELRDSLVRYGSADPAVSEERWAHNFWTPEPLEAEASYRIEVQRSDGAAAASAVVATPPAPDRIVVGIAQPGAGRARFDYLRMEGVKHLAMVHVRPFPFDGCQRHQPNSAISDEDAAPRLTVNRRSLPDTCPASWVELNIVVSGSPWPFDADLAPGVYQQADVASNVEGGIGFVGGIMSVQAPYEECSAATPTPTQPYKAVEEVWRSRVIPSRVIPPKAGIQGGPHLQFDLDSRFRGNDDSYSTAFYCELVYDRDSASLEGTALDIRCDEVPLVTEVTVSVTEVGGDWVRPVTTRSGWYRIGGLRPETIYHLRATAPGFDPVETTLEFSAGERRIHDLRMRRETVCPFA